MDLTNMAQIKDLMEEFGIFAKKKYGQNFLISRKTVERIADEGTGAEDEGVIEIGPGIGVLTRELAIRAKKLIAVEIDTTLIPVLERTLSEFDNVKVINGDVMKTDIKKLVEEEFSHCSGVRVCANLPYYITTPILMSLIEGETGVKSITVMVQKEVADRLCSHSDAGEYGAISAMIAYYGSAKKLFNVNSGCFYPAPKVDSAVIRIDMYEEKPVKAICEKTLKRVIKGAFAQRRKTLVNSLCSEFTYIGKEKMTSIIEELGFSPTVRGEKLSVSEFVKIADRLYEET
ncbi:MAG: 16S rRNA (adenine(1518)-N(6)/adenine(1519)-N(6))-dimethyltransferase RsmA [Ruminococcaceae bacterium]|nr:16S rRNA (adenine(1518)-N(6)/adenine(1519)-N(6))-dimethyltransferase RsmA [Oscillospiraceae bacterium]